MEAHIITILIVTSLLGLALHIALPHLLAWRGVWFCWKTLFGPALVFDSQDQDGTTVRLLNVGGTYQSVCYVDEGLLWLPVCEYHRTWAAAVEDAFGAPGKILVRDALVLGGGGYSFPKWLVAERPDFRLEVVEIDPKICEIARTRFFLDRLQRDFSTAKTGRLKLTCADAWEFLREDERRFDLIVNDVFSKNRPLGPLATDEGARLIRSRLRAGGLFISNVRCPLEGRGAKTLEETERAFRAVFDHVRIIPERPEDPRKVGNNALLAWG